MPRKTDKEIMAQPHWATIETMTTHHAADARSISNPGHGYPAHTTTHLQYRPYETKDEALDYVLRHRDHKTLVLISAQPAKTKLVIETV